MVFRLKAEATASRPDPVSEPDVVASGFVIASAFVVASAFRRNLRNKCFEIAQRFRRGETPSSTVTWNASSSAIISSTRSSELSPSSSIVVEAMTVRPGANRATTAGTLRPASIVAARGAPLGCASHCFSSRRFSLRVPSVRGSSPPVHTAAARIFWWSSRAALAVLTIDVDVHTRVRGPGPPARAPPMIRRSARRRQRSRARRACAFSTRSTSSGKTLSPSGVTIISFLRPRIRRWPPASSSPMSPVWNQPSSNALARFFRRVEVAARDVVAADEDLAVLGDLHLDARDRLADGAAGGAERMVEGHDRRGFGQPVALDDEKPEPPPERFELGIERRGADDERPELEAEHAVDGAVEPPAPEPVDLLGVLCPVAVASA